MNNAKFIIFDKRETVIESLAKDLASFGFVALEVGKGTNGRQDC